MYLVLSTLAMGVGGLLAFIYYARNGLFDDVEDIKYEMFRNEKEVE